MKRASKRDLPPLGLLVFVVGAASLGAEIAAARLMAPFFGASTIVWANTIGVVLVSLAAGYWLGGRFADRNPHKEGLCAVVWHLLVSHPSLQMQTTKWESVALAEPSVR